MSQRLDQLTELAIAVQSRPSIDELLALVVEAAARLVEAQHASVRLLDASCERLVAACRSGDSPEGLASRKPMEFRRGEGLLGWVVEQRECLLLHEPMDDSRFVARPNQRRIASFAGVPLVAGNSCFGVLSALRSDDRFDDEVLRWLTVLAAVCAPQLEIARLNSLTEQDPLTGALNRRGFDRVYPPGGVDGQTMVDPICVVVVDLDHFKRVNDTHGHAVGDEVLRLVMSELQAGVRRNDRVVRLGGEEFLLFLPETNLHRASQVADRIREGIAARTLKVGSNEIRVTISMGVAERALGEPRSDLISRADAAMYAAKEAGRNRIVVAETPRIPGAC